MPCSAQAQNWLPRLPVDPGQRKLAALREAITTACKGAIGKPENAGDHRCRKGSRSLQRVRATFVCVAVVLCSPAWSEPRRLDISKYRETFAETFRGKLDVTPWGPSRWIAHTPWAGDFGDAAFADPQPNFPFMPGPHGLKIIARKADDGKWRSGLLSSVDSNGHGFRQAGGYFEARMKMPPGPGVWPAFWLVGDGDETHKVEVDVVEYYGQFPDVYRATLHFWPKSDKMEPKGAEELIHAPQGALSDAFHTYGVEINDRDVVFYLDRAEVWRQPAVPAMHSRMAVLVNLALGSGWPIDKTINPSTLEVDYIKAYTKR
jgi:beta-glucanase (GH16 family)